jgi:hypothetical protein
MNMTPRQIRIMVTKGELPKGEFQEAFYVENEVVPWWLVFDRRAREFNIVVRGSTIGAIGAGPWRTNDTDAMPRGRGVGIIANFCPLDYLIEWGTDDQLQVMKYIDEE